MARIGSYPDDTLVENNDRIIGTDANSGATVNFPIERLSEFVNSSIFNGITDGETILSYQNTLIPSPLTATISTHVAGSEVATSEINNAIYVSLTNTLNVGTNVDIFSQPQVAAGNVIIIRNGDTRHVAKITSVNSTNREIVFSPELSIAQDIITFGVNGTLSNRVTFVEYTSTVIRGLSSESSGRAFGTASGNIATWAEGDSTETIGTAARIPDLDTSKITSGQFPQIRIPDLPTTKVTNFGSDVDSRINTIRTSETRLTFPNGSTFTGASGIDEDIRYSYANADTARFTELVSGDRREFTGAIRSVRDVNLTVNTSTQVVTVEFASQAEADENDSNIAVLFREDLALRYFVRRGAQAGTFIQYTPFDKRSDTLNEIGTITSVADLTGAWKFADITDIVRVVANSQFKLVPGGVVGFEENNEDLHGVTTRVIEVPRQSINVTNASTGILVFEGFTQTEFDGITSDTVNNRIAINGSGSPARYFGRITATDTTTRDVTVTFFHRETATGNQDVGANLLDDVTNGAQIAEVTMILNLSNVASITNIETWARAGNTDVIPHSKTDGPEPVSVVLRGDHLFNTDTIQSGITSGTQATFTFLNSTVITTAENGEIDNQHFLATPGGIYRFNRLDRTGAGTEGDPFRYSLDTDAFFTATIDTFPNRSTDAMGRANTEIDFTPIFISPSLVTIGEQEASRDLVNQDFVIFEHGSEIEIYGRTKVMGPSMERFGRIHPSWIAEATGTAGNKQIRIAEAADGSLTTSLITEVTGGGAGNIDVLHDSTTTQFGEETFDIRFRNAANDDNIATIEAFSGGTSIPQSLWINVGTARTLFGDEDIFLTNESISIDTDQEGIVWRSRQSGATVNDARIISTNNGTTKDLTIAVRNDANTADLSRLVLDNSGAATFSGDVSAGRFIGDGSQLTNIPAVTTTGNQTITGFKSFEEAANSNGIIFKETGQNTWFGGIGGNFTTGGPNSVFMTAATPGDTDSVPSFPSSIFSAVTVNARTGTDSTVDITNASLSLNTGFGLTFNVNRTSATGVTVASNTLDDYEEGTFTPTLGNSEVITGVEGSYTKIGDVVDINFRFTFPTSTDTAVVRINGLPFAPASTGTTRPYIGSSLRNGIVGAAGISFSGAGIVVVEAPSTTLTYNTASGTQIAASIVYRTTA